MPTQKSTNLKKSHHKKPQKTGCVKKFEIPHYQQYEYINTGYRLLTKSKRNLVKSIFYMHNETVNIWTHLLGAITILVFMCMLIFYYDAYHEFPLFSWFSSLNKYMHEHLFDIFHLFEDGESFYNNNSENLNFLPIYILMGSAFICLMLSAVFHTFHPYSEKASKYLQRADFSGINILIVGSSCAIYYYGFYCLKTIFYIYISTIFVINSAVFIVALQDFIHSQQYQKLKSIMYGACGACSFLPAVHLIIYEAFYSKIAYTSTPGLIFYLFTGLCYGGGLIIYSKKWPEKGKPQKYDVCGSSHQIWHLLVLIAIFFTLMGTINNYELRSQYLQCY